MYACLDIGGTSIKTAVLDEKGNLIKRGNIEVRHNFNELMDSIILFIDGVKSEYDIKGVAISSPGAVDTVTGIVGGASAIPCIHGPNFKEIIRERVNLSVSIENDANCAALAEVFSGSAKGVSDIMFLVCGTGIGGAIIKDGKIHHGKHLHGGEFGYMLMEEENGEYKNFSEVASTMSFVRKVRKHYNDDLIDGVEVFSKAEAGDEFCKSAIDTFYRTLAKGIFNLQYVYDPELILLGGAISEREDFIDRLNESMDTILKKVEIAKVKPMLGTCTHKKDANLVGALAHHFNEYNNK